MAWLEEGAGPLAEGTPRGTICMKVQLDKNGFGIGTQTTCGNAPMFANVVLAGVHDMLTGRTYGIGALEQFSDWSPDAAMEKARQRLEERLAALAVSGADPSQSLHDQLALAVPDPDADVPDHQVQELAYKAFSEGENAVFAAKLHDIAQFATDGITARPLDILLAMRDEDAFAEEIAGRCIGERERRDMQVMIRAARLCGQAKEDPAHCWHRALRLRAALEEVRDRAVAVRVTRGGEETKEDVSSLLFALQGAPAPSRIAGIERVTWGRKVLYRAAA